MRFITALTLLALTPGSGLHAQEQVQFFASPTSPGGAPVRTLAASDFDVKEDGTPAKVVKVEPIDWPVKVELLLDNGAGIGADNLIHLRNGLRGFVEALPDGIEVSILTTAPQPRTLVRPTTDRQQLLNAAAVLTPDAGAGRFADALIESAGRINGSHGDKAGGRYFPVVVAVASTAVQGIAPIERNVEQALQRFGQHAATVHVVMLTNMTGGGGAGANQTAIGTAVAEITGGRYENISAVSRIATLLPELAKQIATSHAQQSHQYRVTIQRPQGMAGPLGRVTVGARGASVKLSLDGHIP